MDKWKYPAGVMFYVALLAGGYYYNLTFVQLGLLDLGENVLQLPQTLLSGLMAMLALGAFASALFFSKKLSGRDFESRFRMLFYVISFQAVLTLLSMQISGAYSFAGWIILASVALGAGIPLTFGMIADLVKARHRPPVAATITGLAFFIASIYPPEWNFSSFAGSMAAFMVPGVLLLGLLAFSGNKVISSYSRNRAKPEFSKGKHSGKDGFYLMVALMFVVFFVDSLGFLRIIQTPWLAAASWLSPDFSTHLFIGVVHLVTALLAGIIYKNIKDTSLFVWIFGMFALTHFMYSQGAESGSALALPMMYAIVVSFYTVVSFAIWADYSNGNDIERNVALGIGIAGWLSTFLSTSLSVLFEHLSVNLLQHLRIVNAFSIMAFVLLLAGNYVWKMRKHAA